VGASLILAVSLQDKQKAEERPASRRGYMSFVVQPKQILLLLHPRCISRAACLALTKRPIEKWQ
jgi:hypothetical protein